MNTSTEVDYIGDVLQVAESAKNWKSYFAKKLKKYISGDVMEVGAGIGTNTPFFIDERMENISSWTYVEPNPAFIEVLKKRKSLTTPNMLNQLRDKDC